VSTAKDGRYADRVLTLCDRHAFSLADVLARYMDGDISAEQAKRFGKSLAFDKCAGPGKDCRNH
jgi:hypothetical protein